MSIFIQGEASQSAALVPTSALSRDGVHINGNKLLEITEPGIRIVFTIASQESKSATVG